MWHNCAERTISVRLALARLNRLRVVNMGRWQSGRMRQTRHRAEGERTQSATLTARSGQYLYDLL